MNPGVLIINSFTPYKNFLNLVLFIILSNIFNLSYNLFQNIRGLSKNPSNILLYMVLLINLILSILKILTFDIKNIKKNYKNTFKEKYMIYKLFTSDIKTNSYNDYLKKIQISLDGFLSSGYLLLLLSSFDVCFIIYCIFSLLQQLLPIFLYLYINIIFVILIGYKYSYKKILSTFIFSFIFTINILLRHYVYNNELKFNKVINPILLFISSFLNQISLVALGSMILFINNYYYISFII